MEWIAVLLVSCLNIVCSAWAMEYLDVWQFTSNIYLNSLIVWISSLVLIAGFFHFCVEKFTEGTSSGMIALIFFVIPLHPWSGIYLLLMSAYLKIKEILGEK